MILQRYLGEVRVALDIRIPRPRSRTGTRSDLKLVSKYEYGDLASWTCQGGCQGGAAANTPSIRTVVDGT